MKIRLLGALAALVGLPLLVQGCHGDIIDPVVEIPEKRVLVVVPFREQDYSNGFESPRGTDLAQRITKALRQKAEFRVKPFDVVLALYDEDNPTTLTAKQVAEKTHADYVLMGEIVRFQTQDDNTYGLYRGTAIIDCSLYETADAANERVKDEKDREDLPQNGRGRLAFSKRRVNAVFPQEYGMAQIGTTEMGPGEIEPGLMNAAAVKVAWLLCAHTKDEEKLSAGK